MPANPNPYVSKVMTNLVLERMQDFGPDGGFVGTQLMPFVPVQGVTGTFYKRNSVNFKELPDNYFERGSKSPTMTLPDWSTSTQTYLCRDFAIAAEVAKADLDKSEAVVDVSRRREVKRAQDSLMLQHEKLIRAIVAATGTYSTDAPHNFKTGVASGVGTDEFLQWDDANATPLQDIEGFITEAIKTSGVAPNFILIPKQVWAIIKYETKFINTAFTGQINVLTPEMFGSYFGIKNVFIPQTIRDTAALGEAASYDFVWRNEVVLGALPDEPSRECRAFGYTFLQTDLEGGAPSNGPRVRSWEDQSKGRGVYYDAVEMVIDREVIDPTLFFYLKNPVAGVTQL